MNDYERTLLTGARTRIELEMEDFICCALDTENFVLGNGYKSEKFAINVGIQKKLHAAMDGAYTVEGYLYRMYGYRPEPREWESQPDAWSNATTTAEKITYFAQDKFDILARQARLAWIDRMLDNDEVN